jgi:AcrR family transcriptional regulator
MPQRTTAGAVPVWTLPPPPARQRALGREEIVAAAIELADSAGADALTMKAVAARLGPYTPMALYRYVHSKDGLVDLMLDTVMGTVAVPDRPGPHWRDDLHTLATRTRAMVKAHPWYAGLVHARPPAGPNTMRRTEFMLAVLVARGASIDAAMTFAALIYRHIGGSGLQEAQEARFNASHGIDTGEKLLAAIATVHDLAAADGHLPLLTTWLADPSPAAVDDQFELGLDFLLTGIATNLRRSRANPNSR